MIGQLAGDIDELADRVRTRFPQLSYIEVVLGGQTKCAWALPLDAQSAETGTLAECLSRLGVTVEQLRLNDMDHGESDSGSVSESESGSESESERERSAFWGNESESELSSDDYRGF